MAADLKAARGNAQRRADEIIRLLLDDEDGLAALLAIAQRAGLDGAKIDAAYAALRAATHEAAELTATLAAVPTVRLGKQRVVL